MNCEIKPNTIMLSELKRQTQNVIFSHRHLEVSPKFLVVHLMGSSIVAHKFHVTIDGVFFLTPQWGIEMFIN